MERADPIKPTIERKAVLVMERLMLTVDEVAEVLGVGRSAVYDLMRLRKLASVKIGRSRRVQVEALRDYVIKATAASEGIAA